MKEKFAKFRDLVGPYEYSTNFIVFSFLIFMIPRVKAYSYQYPYGVERIHFSLIGILVDSILLIPVYLMIRLSKSLWGARYKSFSIYILEIALMTTVSLVSKIAGEKFLIPHLNVINFLETGPFFGEFLTRFLFALIFVAFTHNRQRNLQIQLDSAQNLNKNLSDKYSMLINSDEEIRSQASRLLHDRIQAKLMLAGAKLTRLSGLLSDEG